MPSGTPPFPGPLFFGLQEDELRAVAARAVVMTVPRHTVVIREGELSGSLYVILSGKVKIYLSDASGKELPLDVKGPGGYFGEMALDGGPRSASAVTLEESSFTVIAKDDFRRLLLEFPAISLHVINNLVHAVRSLNENLRSFAMLDIYGRLSKLLRELAVEERGRLVISEKLTQREIASRVGSSREMINRIFRNLSAGGYIQLEGRKIIITKPLPKRL
jgi:CRP/FNR family cyclic AMP-dependent transcriptional regulator